jgi:hypothetical protein
MNEGDDDFDPTEFNGEQAAADPASMHRRPAPRRRRDSSRGGDQQRKDRGDRARGSDNYGERIEDQLIEERDTALIVGRQASGKSTYLARLFMELDAHDSRSLSRHKLSLELPDAASSALMNGMRSELERGQWFGATVDVNEMRFRVWSPERSLELAYLDYPGEVFSRTFVAGDYDSPRHRRLLEAIRRACHVFLLVDPGQVRVPIDSPADEAKRREREDNTLGFARMLEYLRNTNDGAAVPVSIILTKADEQWPLITAEAILAEAWQARNWVDEVAKSMLPHVYRAAEPFVRVETVAAVRSRVDPETLQSRPDLDLPPINLVESFKRAIHFSLLAELRAEARKRAGDTAKLRSLLERAERCGLSAQHYPEVRLAQNRASGSGAGQDWMPGAQLAELLQEYRSLDPEANVDDLLQDATEEPPRP